MSSLSQIQRIAHRYNFTDEELEILLRSHDALCHAMADVSDMTGHNFFNILAHSSPYVFFFLPGDEIKARLDIIHDSILPPGFCRRLWDKFFSHLFSLSERDSSLDRFISALADCGRSGPEPALNVIFDCCSCDDGPSGLVDTHALIQLCHSLVISTAVLTSPSRDTCLSFTQDTFYLKALVDFFQTHVTEQKKPGFITKTDFMNIAKLYTPMLHQTLSSFMHSLIFHGRTTPEELKLFQIPKFHQRSEIFADCSSSTGFLFGCLATEVHGNVSVTLLLDILKNDTPPWISIFSH
jgi:hypothetical protein